MITQLSTINDSNMSFLYGDVDKVVTNRQAFFMKHGLELTNSVFLRTQDQPLIYKASVGDKGKGSDTLNTAIPADAIYTDEKELILSLLTADCLPLIITHAAQECIALAHLSRNSAETPLIPNLVSTLVQEYGLNPADMIVTGGPCVQASSYLLDSSAPINFSVWRNYLTWQSDTHFSLDLPGLVKEQLITSGFQESNITLSSEDTVSNQTYFSHYRSVKTGEPEGRMLTIAQL